MNKHHSVARSIAVVPLAEVSRQKVHPLSATLLILVDSLWSLPEWSALSWILTIPLSFITVAFPVCLVQWTLNRDSLSRATGIAFILALLAAVPTPITGTMAGTVILALSGWKQHRWKST